MEFLKDLFSNGPLTYEQLCASVEKAGLKVVNLTDGGYVSKEKFDNTKKTLEDTAETYKTQLSDANVKIAEFKDLDVESIKGEVAAWKIKAENAAKENEALTYRHFIDSMVAQEKFSSKAAKKAFAEDLAAKKLPVQDGKLLGYEDFKAAYVAQDPTAFATEKQKPGAIPPVGASGSATALTAADYKKLSYLEKVKLKQDNPELYKKLRG